MTSAIWKSPTRGRLRFAGVNAEGDVQADGRVHGGPDKAVYAYAAEDYQWWSQSWPGVESGTFGDNLTTSGLPLEQSYIGDRWHIGSATLEVAQPRTPCFKLGIRMESPEFPSVFAAANRPGLYLRIVTPGTIGAGDRIEVEAAAIPAVRAIDLTDPAVTTEVLRRASLDPRVPPGWRRAAQRHLNEDVRRAPNA